MTPELPRAPIDRFARKQSWKHRGVDPATGRKFCFCGCGQLVGPRRSSSAGSECVKRWKSHSDMNHIRFQVQQRDKGVCAFCGRDTEKLRRQAGHYGCPIEPPDAHAIAVGLGYKHAYQEGPGVGYLWKPDVEAAYEVAAWLHRQIDNEWRTHQHDVRNEMFGQGFPCSSRRWWEADHIVPVVEGGGGCDVAGYRTLCVPCHKQETARLAARRAARRRSVNVSEMPTLQLT